MKLHYKLPLITTFALLAASAFAASPVTVETPERGSATPSFSFTGTITAQRVAALSPRVAGLVQIADAEAGHRARKGDTLVQLDETLAKLALSESESELHRAETDLAEAKRRLQEAIELGERNFPRTEREARAATVRLAEAAVAQIQTALERQKELVERHKVIAPFDGVVQRKHAEIGEWVQTGDPVVELVEVTSLRLDVQVPQEQLSLAKRTSKVDVLVPGFDGRPLQGEVEAIAPAIDAGTRSLLVRVSLIDPPPSVRPGMSARAVFRPADDTPPLTISRDAIIRSANGETQVWIAHGTDGDLRATARIVTLGTTRGTQVEVLSGLDGYERVVVRGNESLRENQTIRIVQSNAQQAQSES